MADEEKKTSLLEVQACIHNKAGKDDLDTLEGLAIHFTDTCISQLKISDHRLEAVSSEPLGEWSLKNERVTWFSDFLDLELEKKTARLYRNRWNQRGMGYELSLMFASCILVGAASKGSSPSSCVGAIQKRLRKPPSSVSISNPYRHEGEDIRKVEIVHGTINNPGTNTILKYADGTNQPFWPQTPVPHCYLRLNDKYIVDVACVQFPTCWELLEKNKWYFLGEKYPDVLGFSEQSTAELTFTEVVQKLGDINEKERKLNAFSYTCSDQ